MCKVNEKKKNIYDINNEQKMKRLPLRKKTVKNYSFL